jgi:NADH:ubiquinone oxidoreductase subunit 5 (subunit L)/multisubunit Na+/H+ antiporter MnhA subunit
MASVAVCLGATIAARKDSAMTLADLLAAAVAGAPALLAARARRDGLSGDALLAQGATALWAGFAGVVLLGLGVAAGWAESGLLRAGAPLSLILAGLVAAVAATVADFSRRHVAADPRLDLYAQRLLALASAAMLTAIAADVLTFAAAWVVSGLLLAQLIGHVADWPAARAAGARARRAFLMGDAALVAGLALLAAQAGTLRIDGILAAAGRGDATVPALLILAAAVARSALWPAHGWLITSVAAPTPVSALMHAGLVNAGGLALATFAPVMLAAPIAMAAAFVLGAATAVLGGAIMLTRTDVKRGLAGSTVGQMGFMVMQCGLGAFGHAVFHIVAHGMFKAALFLGAGGNVRAKGPAAASGVGAPLAAGGAAVALLALAAVAGAPVSPAKPSTLLALFALVTAAQAFGAALGPTLRLGTLGLVGAVGAACAALYAGGVWAVTAALGPDLGAARPAGALEWLGVLAFLAAWAAVQSPALRARLVGPRLHAWLLNLGRSPAVDAAPRRAAA